MGRYLIRRLLNTSGGQTVFAALDPIRDQEVEVILQPLSLPASASERYNALTVLDHPGILRTYEHGVHQGWRYLVREPLTGRSLADLIACGETPDIPSAMRYTLQLARALGKAHRSGLRHGWLTPEAVFLDSGRARLSGFGPSDRDVLRTFPENPHFMAPEQIGTPPSCDDHRSDIHALGAILHCMLVGRPPHTGRSAAHVACRILHAPLVSPRIHRPSLPPELEAILQRCLARNPAHRYQSMAELAEDLERWQAGQPVQAEPARLRWQLGKESLSSLLACLAFAVVVGMLESCPATALNEEHVVDRLMRHRTKQPLAPSLEIVGFDTQPVPKNLLSSVLARIIADKPDAVMVDVHLDNPKFLKDSERKRLVQVIGRSQSVVLAHRLASEQFGGDVQPITALAPLDNIQRGFTNLRLDGDGVVRRIAYERPGLPPSDAYPLAIRTLRVAGRRPLAREGFIQPDRTFRISFPPQRQLFDSRMLPADRVLAMRRRGRFTGKMVLVGFVATRPEQIADRIPTPTSQKLPGLYVHAAILDTLLRSNGVRPVPDHWQWSLLLACLLVVLLGGRLTRLTARPAILGWALTIFLALLIPAGYLLAAIKLYHENSLLLWILYPMAALLLVGPFNALIHLELERHRVRRLARRLQLPEA